MLTSVDEMSHRIPMAVLLVHTLYATVMVVAVAVPL
jgi:hypothetical protein